MASTTSCPQNVTGFSSDAWLGTRGVWLSSDSTVVGLTSVRLKRVFPLLCTPPWALHTGWTGSLQAQQDLRAKLVETTSMLGVVDLGPLADPRPRGTPMDGKASSGTPDNVHCPKTLPMFFPKPV